MTDLFYDDLLSVPFKMNGRDKDGMDCYGLVLECCRRTDQKLNDLIYKWNEKGAERISYYYPKTNTEEIPAPEKYCIVQCDYKNELHVGFMLDSQTVLHMTYEGVRITPLFILQNKKYFKVKK